MIPLGLRNNNPGNLRPSTPPFEGAVGENSNFVIFITMEKGLRALAKNLIAYQKHSDGKGGVIDTVEEAINRWAPPKDHNDTSAYVAMVCHVLECNTDDRFNFSDRDFLFWMITAIGMQEQGAKAFHDNVTDAQIDAGIEMALA
jgi:hypothetical protein